jgi:hypothetical protein
MGRAVPGEATRLVHIIGLATAALVGVTTAPARATRAGVVDWSAPGGCPDATVVARRVDALLRDRADRVLEAIVHVAREGDAFVSTVRVRTMQGQGERSVKTATCDAAAEASALIIALSAAPDLRVSGRDTPANGAAAPESGAPSARDGAAAVGPAVSVPESSHEGTSPAPADGPHPIFVGAALSVDTNVLPSPAFGPSLFFGVHPVPSIAIEASATWWPPQVAWQTRTIGGQITVYDASLRACYVSGVAVALGACAGVFADLIQGKGIGAPVIRDAAWIAWGPLAGGSARLAIAPRWGLSLAIEGAIPVVRRDFIFQNLKGVVYSPPAATVRSRLGLDVAF